MSAMNQADVKLGGRLQLACDALGENKLRTAAGIFMEIAGDLNLEAEQTTGLLAPEEEDWSVDLPKRHNPYDTPENKVLCGRNVHAWGAIDAMGRATCLVCGMVNVAPKDPNQPGGGGGPVDLSQYT